LNRIEYFLRFALAYKRSDWRSALP
jgi:hypothetical protein